MSMRLTDDITRAAEKTFTVNLEQAKGLPGMLGRITPGMLAFHGFYTVTVDGVKTLYHADKTDPAFAELKRRAESLRK
jgi:hypothetical protein